MSALTRFRVVQGDLLSRVLDGEAIVIDMRSGSYYAMPGSAAVVWSRLEGGANVDEACEAVGQAFQVEGEAVRPDVAAFVASLCAAGLVAEIDDTPSAAAPLPAVPAPAAPVVASAEAYQPPRLETYTDLQDFLLVDPIHEIDERGWPQAPGTAHGR